MRNRVLPSIRKKYDNDFCLQQDHAPIHDDEINMFPWSSLSPDFNLVENAWSMMVKIIHSKGPIKNKAQLRRRTTRAASTIRGEIIKNLFGTIPQRLDTLKHAQLFGRHKSTGPLRSQCDKILFFTFNIVLEHDAI